MARSIPPRKVSIRDLARELGVSTATVSNAFNRPEVVKPQTRQRVLDAASKSRYMPDRIARALKTRRTKQLGIIAPTLSNPFYVDIVNRAQVTAWERGFDMVLTNSESWAVENEIKACRHLTGLHVEGVILVRRARVARNDHLRALMDQGMKVMLLDRPAAIVDGMSCLDVDMVAGTRTAVEHLLALGHRRLMLLTPAKTHTDGLPIAHDTRQLGIEGTFRDAGLPMSAVEFLVSGAESMQHAYEAVRKRLARGNMPTAIIGSNDQGATGALAALLDAGARVPQDFSVIGFDNTEYSRFIRPALTTVSQSHLDVGRHAVDILLAAIEHPEQPPRKITLMPELLVRGSTGPCASP